MASAPRREALLKGQKEVVPFRNIHTKTYFKAVTEALQRSSYDNNSQDTGSPSLPKSTSAFNNFLVSPSLEVKLESSADNLTIDPEIFDKSEFDLHKDKTRRSLNFI